MDRKGLVLNCHTADTMNDSRLVVHCSLLCWIHKLNPIHTKIWGHMTIGLTTTKYTQITTSVQPSDEEAQKEQR